MTQHQSLQTEAAPQLADLVDHLVSFDGPAAQFLSQLLAVQCQLGPAVAGAIFRAEPGQELRLLAWFDDGARPAAEGEGGAWIEQARGMAGRVMESQRSIVQAAQPGPAAVRFYQHEPTEQIVALPLKRDGVVRGVQAFLIARPRGQIGDIQQRLELSTALLSLYEMRLTMRRRGTDLRRLKQAQEVLAAVNDARRWRTAAMALCNEIAAGFGAHRAALGILSGRYVKLVAMSHTEKLTRQMELVQSLELAMEECLDQDTEVVCPGADEAGCVSRAAEAVAREQGGEAICLLPLRRAGQVEAVLAVERDADKPFTTSEIETLRLTCELCTARLLDLHEQDRWIGIRAVRAVRRNMAKALGPEHTWAKAAALAVLGLVIFFSLAKGQYHVQAPVMIEAEARRVVSAPFEGELALLHVEPGDVVEAGASILAELDVTDLRLELSSQQAELWRHRREAAMALRDGDVLERELAEAEADRTAARIGLLEHRLASAVIRSPIDGVVVRGDLRRRLGGPVDKGELLFEVAALDALRGELRVPEHRIADVEVGQRGRLASATYPGRFVGFEVVHVNPVAEVEDDENVFHTRVRLDEIPPWLRPGMEGVARVEAGERLLIRIWTREVVDWVRMKLWI